MRHEVDFAAYDPPELTLSPVEGGDPVLVICLDPSFAILTGKQARGVLRIHVHRRGGHGSHD